MQFVLTDFGKKLSDRLAVAQFTGIDFGLALLFWLTAYRFSG